MRTLAGRLAGIVDKGVSNGVPLWPASGGGGLGQVLAVCEAGVWANEAGGMCFRQPGSVPGLGSSGSSLPALVGGTISGIWGYSTLGLLLHFG